MQENWVVFYYSFLFSLITFFVAYRNGFFRPFHSSQLPIITGKKLALGFSSYLFFQLILMPLLLGIVYVYHQKSIHTLNNLDPLSKGWWTLLFMVVGFLSLIPTYFSLWQDQRAQLTSQTSVPWYKQIAFGIFSWLVIFPAATAFSQLLTLVISHFVEHPEMEQVVIQNMRGLSAFPLLFILLGTTIVLLVPLTEEFLFRGLLQNWLKKNLHSATGSVLLSSLIFACFHLSPSIGWTNVVLLPTLFLLSCMLGYIYERQRSLWAPIGLHAFYNLVSLLSILVGSE